MTSLDLSIHPPRGPREKLDGLCMLPRTIDKLRASLPGGNLNGYKIPGMTLRMLAALGVSEEDLRTTVERARDDAEVAAWLRTKTDPARYRAVNETLEKRSLADMTDRTHMDVLYPWLAASPLTNVFDIMEEDDRRTYSSVR